MTENSDSNGSLTDEDLEYIKKMAEEDLRYAEDHFGDYPAPRWWIDDPFYDDVD